MIKPRKLSMMVCDATGSCGLSPTKVLMLRMVTCIQKVFPGIRMVRKPYQNKMKNNAKFMTR